MAHIAPEPELVNQPSKTPTRKVTAAALSGAVVTIAVYVGGLFDFTLPAEVATACTVILSFAASYLTREYNTPRNPET